MIHSANRIVLWLSAALLLIALPRIASAQFDPEDTEEHPRRAFLPKIGPDDLGTFIFLADLSPEQRKSMLDLHSAYLARNHAASEKMFEYQDALAGDGHPDAIHKNSAKAELYSRAMEARIAHVKKLDDDLESDLKAVLLAEQAPAWAYLEDGVEFRRNTWDMPQGQGTRTDLVALVNRTLRNDASPVGLRDLLLRYSRDYRAAIEEASKGGPERPWEIRADPNLSPEEKKAKLRESNLRALARTRPVQEVQDSYLDRMKPLLSPSRYIELQHRFFIRAEFINRWQDELLWRALARVKDLSPEQRAALTGLRASMRAADVAIAARRWKEKLAKTPEEIVNDEGGIERDFRGWDEQQELSAANFDAVRRILTERQQELAGPPVYAQAAVPPRFGDPDAPEPEVNRDQDGRPLPVDAPEITEQDISYLARIAPLTEPELAAARDLWGDYAARFRRAARQWSAFSTALQAADQAHPGSGQESWKLREATHSAYKKHAVQLRADLLDNLGAFRTEERAEGWKRFEQLLRRAAIINPALWDRAPLRAMNIEAALQAALGQSTLPPELDARLLRYESELDLIMRKVEGLVQDQKDLRARARKAEGMWVTPDGLKDLRSQSDALMDKAAELNAEFARAIAPRLPPLPRFRFLEELLRAPAALIRRYRPAGAEWSASELIDHVAHLPPELVETPEQHAAMEELALRLLPTLQTTNDSFIRILSSAAAAGEDRREKEYAAREARHNDLLESVKLFSALLTPAQLEKLPRPYQQRPLPEPPVFAED